MQSAAEPVKPVRLPRIVYSVREQYDEKPGVAVYVKRRSRKSVVTVGIRREKVARRAETSDGELEAKTSVFRSVRRVIRYRALEGLAREELFALKFAAG